MKTAENMVFVALNGWVVALDRDTGKRCWKWKTPKPVSYMTLLPDRDRLIVSAGGHVYCLDLSKGQERWHNPLKGFGIHLAALATIPMRTAENMVFVALKGLVKGWVVALDRDTGDIQWQWPVSRWGKYMTLLPDRDRLIVSAGGYIYCLDPSTGQERWNNPLKGYGLGVAALATIYDHSPHSDVASAEAQDEANSE